MTYWRSDSGYKATPHPWPRWTSLSSWSKAVAVLLFQIHTVIRNIPGQESRASDSAVAGGFRVPYQLSAVLGVVQCLNICGFVFFSYWAVFEIDDMDDWESFKFHYSSNRTSNPSTGLWGREAGHCLSFGHLFMALFLCLLCGHTVSLMMAKQTDSLWTMLLYISLHTPLIASVSAHK